MYLAADGVLSASVLVGLGADLRGLASAVTRWTDLGCSVLDGDDRVVPS